MSAVQSTCFAQQTANLSHHVSWSRHLLSCLRRILGADLLIGARAVVFNPHFQHFFSPEAIDLELGGVQFWPAVPVLLLLDSFLLTERAQILAQAAAHCSVVWVLRPLPGSAVCDSCFRLNLFAVFQSRLVALLSLFPAKSMVLHPVAS